MTVAFEFLFGYYVAKRPWSVLLHDYNLSQGLKTEPAFVVVFRLPGDPYQTLLQLAELGEAELVSVMTSLPPRSQS